MSRLSPEQIAAHLLLESYPDEEVAGKRWHLSSTIGPCSQEEAEEAADRVLDVLRDAPASAGGVSLMPERNG